MFPPQSWEPVIFYVTWQMGIKIQIELRLLIQREITLDYPGGENVITRALQSGRSKLRRRVRRREVTMKAMLLALKINKRP